MSTEVWLDDREERTSGLKDALRKVGVYADVTRLEYADLRWAGKQDGKAVVVGMERKTVGDLLSVIATKRFAGHQLEGLLDEHHVVYLLVEGRWRSGLDGSVEVWKKSKSRGKWGWYSTRSRVGYREAMGWLETMGNVVGLKVRMTEDTTGTARLVRVLADWWAKDKHKSHQAVYCPVPSGKVGLVKPNLVWKMAAQLPGVEMKGREIAKKFKTPAQMVAADEKTWREIPGVGKVLAGNIVKLLQGGQR